MGSSITTAYISYINNSKPLNSTTNFTIISNLILLNNTMANDIIPQDLLIYRNILISALNKITNEMYADNIKTSFKYSFTLVPKEEKPSVFLSTAKPLYLFCVEALDKSNNPVGTTHRLYNNYYPKDITESVYQLERKAIQDWFLNASKALYNVIHTDYIEEYKAKKEIADKMQAEGVTPETIKAELDKRTKERIQQQEYDVLRMLHPNIGK